jgi:hypothetical protein
MAFDCAQRGHVGRARRAIEEGELAKRHAGCERVETATPS